MTGRLIFIVLITISLSSCNQRAVKFKQIYSGENGPNKIGTQYFSASSDLDNSWVRNSLNETSYKDLIKKADFSRQMVVAFSAGEYTTFSGKIIIVDIHQYTGVESLPIDVLVKIGVYSEKCSVERKSFPFALAIMEIPPGFQPVGGIDLQNFGDGCPS